MASDRVIGRLKIGNHNSLNQKSFNEPMAKSPDFFVSLCQSRAQCRKSHITHPAAMVPRMNKLKQ
jgi:hypothetical protein